MNKRGVSFREIAVSTVRTFTQLIVAASVVNDHNGVWCEDVYIITYSYIEPQGRMNISSPELNYVFGCKNHGNLNDTKTEQEMRIYKTRVNNRKTKKKSTTKKKKTPFFQ